MNQAFLQFNVYLKIRFIPLNLDSLQINLFIQINSERSVGDIFADVCKNMES